MQCKKTWLIAEETYHCVRHLGHVGEHQIHAAVAHEACMKALAEVARPRKAMEMATP